MEKVEETRFSEGSRRHLQKSVVRRFNKAMAEILNAVELAYKQDKKGDDKFWAVRKTILDVMNDEKNNLLSETEKYVIFKKVYYMEMPFVGKEGEVDGNR